MIAPMAPRIRSSHMNQNLRWPGVPNRYSTKSSSRVMRPKSMATVVVVFNGVAARPSTPSDALVTNASVRSGMISEIAPTKVVLPAPNPPETTIFVEAGARLAEESVEACRLSECPEATQRPSYQFSPLVVRRRAVERGVHLQVTLCHQVTDQHPSHTERQSQLSRDLGNRREIDTHCEDLTPHIVSRPPRWLRRRQSPDRRFQRQMYPRRSAAGCQCVRPDQTRFVCDLLFPQWSPGCLGPLRMVHRPLTNAEAHAAVMTGPQRPLVPPESPSRNRFDRCHNCARQASPGSNRRPPASTAGSRSPSRPPT